MVILGTFFALVNFFKWSDFSWYSCPIDMTHMKNHAGFVIQQCVPSVNIVNVNHLLSISVHCSWPTLNHFSGALFFCSIYNFECFCSPIRKPLLAEYIFFSIPLLYVRFQTILMIISTFIDKNQCIKKCRIKWAGNFISDCSKYQMFFLYYLTIDTFVLAYRTF